VPSQSWKPSEGNWESILTGELLVCGLLAKVLLSIPKRDWIDALLSDDVLSEAPFGTEQAETQIGQKELDEWSINYQNGIDDEGLKDLKIDHTRLFTGMRNLPVVPWESVYFSEERMVFQESTLNVRSWYRRFGLESVDLYREPDDHIGLEISFVGHLAGLALSALKQGNAEEFERVLNAQRDFFSQHLLLWGPLWCSQMVKYAQTPFYRGIAYLTSGMLVELADLFDLKVPDYIDT